MESAKIRKVTSNRWRMPTSSSSYTCWRSSDLNKARYTPAQLHCLLAPWGESS